MKGSKTPRRRFLQAAVSVASGAAAGCASRKGSWRYLTVDEADTVAAIAERLIPTDEHPGAKWAGAANFIDLQLMGPYKRFQKRYREGLGGVDQVSRSRYGKRFAELVADEQDALLSALDKSETPAAVWNPAQAKQFFEMILSHTMQAFYGDPRHGGNREMASWRMLGVPITPVRGREQYDLTRRDS